MFVLGMLVHCPSTDPVQGTGSRGKGKPLSDVRTTYLQPHYFVTMHGESALSV